MKVLTAMSLLAGAGLLVSSLTFAQPELSIQMGQEEVRYNMGPLEKKNVCQEYSPKTGQCVSWQTVTSRSVISKGICQKRDVNSKCIHWVFIPVE